VNDEARADDRIEGRDLQVIGVLLVATFVVILNETVMSTAIPVLQVELGVHPSVGQWLTTIFMLTMAVIIPLNGYLIQRIPTRTLFVLAMSLFTAGTLIAFPAPGFGVLVRPHRAGIRDSPHAAAADDDDDDHDAGATTLASIDAMTPVWMNPRASIVSAVCVSEPVAENRQTNRHPRSDEARQPTDFDDLRGFEDADQMTHRPAFVPPQTPPLVLVGAQTYGRKRTSPLCGLGGIGCACSRSGLVSRCSACA